MAKLLGLCLHGTLTAVLVFTPVSVLAESSNDLSALLRELEQLRSDQAQINARMNDIEQRLSSMPGKAVVLPEALSKPQFPDSVLPKPAAPTSPKFEYSGDVRLRYESNSGSALTPDRERGVFRGRMRGAYILSDRFAIGAELVTGDRDDPNTADVTMSQFVDDVDLGLSQLYAKTDIGGVQVFGGKFPQIFKRTDLVWDGDVNPQGVGAATRWDLSQNLALNATGVYVIIDEAGSGPDSNMLGGQITVDTQTSAAWGASISAGYYNYDIVSRSGADAGDYRSNTLRSDGSYMSDFNILDVIGTVKYQGFGTRWPVTLTVDYVKNLGANISGDEGYSARISSGVLSAPNDWRVAYGYQQAETDAVFAAFSHDNLPLATNYKSHELGLDYAVSDSVSLNATWYHFRPLALNAAMGMDPNWRDRIRLNALLNF